MEPKPLRLATRDPFAETSTYPRRLCARRLAGWCALIIVRSLKARKSAEAPEGRSTAALDGRFIGPPRSGCQRRFSRNLHIAETLVFPGLESGSRAVVPHLSHIPRTF
jgi:hypothetical protein